MKDATFLLAINLTIGVSFSISYFILAKGARRVLGLCCGSGFLAASGVAVVETLAPYTPSARLTSGMSFGLLLIALTLIVCGLASYLKRPSLIPWMIAFCGAAIIFHQLVIFDLRRDSPEHAFSYQMPFALVTATGAAILLMSKTLRPVHWALATVLAVSAVQFVIKSFLAATITTGAGVTSYITSAYAHYSQTAAAILSLLLGLALLALLVREHIASTLHVARLDLLTGTMSRALFYEEADKILQTPSTPFCLILCDLDHFKRVNDDYGHAAGDEVLARFGQFLLQVTGEAGICGRIGGEEFAVLIQNCDTPGGQVFVQGMNKVMHNSRYSILPDDVAVSASFGIACIKPGETLATAMQRSDRALYAAKDSGRNCYRIAI